MAEEDRLSAAFIYITLLNLGQIYTSRGLQTSEAYVFQRKERAVDGIGFRAATYEFVRLPKLLVSILLILNLF